MSKPYHIPSTDELKTFLRAKGLKATRQRISVHEAMLELGHASADMVTDFISEAGGPAVTVASVYNILTQFNQLGIYKRRLSSNNKMYFDVNTSQHMHLYDTYNNEYKDVFDEDIQDAVRERLKYIRFKGYKVDGIDIQIICHPSRRKSAASR